MHVSAGFIVFPLLWLVNIHVLRHAWRYTDWIYTLTHIWLLYYYISLSLRENILKVVRGSAGASEPLRWGCAMCAIAPPQNGSNIRPWWIYHHYVSSVMSVIVLTWPAGSKCVVVKPVAPLVAPAPRRGRVPPPHRRSWESFLPQFTWYFLYQGLVQFFQARYQKARHYARRALGKADHMDIANSETINEFHAGLWIIVALVVIAQGWQVRLSPLARSLAPPRDDDAPPSPPPRRS